MDKIIEFISENMNDYDEIHISYDMSKHFLSKYKLEIDKNFEQNIIGDTFIGNLQVNNKTIKVFYNILYEFDEIEFKYKK